jgi:hypothetical protein
VEEAMLNKLKFIQGASLLMLLGPLQVFAMTSTGEIKGFQMKSCGHSKCFTVTSDKVNEGILVGNYFSKNAKFSIENKISKKKIVEIETQSLYYDNIHNFIYIKDVVGEKAQYSYEISTEKLERYPIKN